MSDAYFVLRIAWSVARLRLSEVQKNVERGLERRPSTPPHNFKIALNEFNACHAKRA